MHLNKAQQKAACHFQGPCMVLAGPGSGKTLTIAARIENLIKRYKVRPEEILVITFTRYASYEMQNRFKSLMGGVCPPVTFGTFHGIYYGILRWAYGFTSANILTGEESSRLLGQILALPELDLKLEVEDEQDFIRDLLTEIGKVKNNGLDIQTYKASVCPGAFADIYQMYEKKRKEMRKIDFDDMLILCHELFKSRPDILEKWQARFRYILVDEFQDVNKIQYEILKMLALPENNLFVVGDDDQSIYQFRGADPSIMLGFSRDYPDAGQILLDVNYRSTAHILNGALRVIGHNEQRFSKEIKPHAGKGECVHVQEVLDVTEEGKYVIEGVKKRMEQGVPAREIAVLFRTNRDARILAEMLAEHQIPFEMKENIQNIYDHFIARNIKSYMQLASGSRERRYFLDIMNCPKRYLSRECLESSRGDFEEMRKFYCDKGWMQDRIDQFEWDVKMMENKTPYAAIQYIRKKIGYDDYLKEYAKIRRIREEDLFEILYEIQERSKEFQSFEEWFLYIENYGQMLKEKKGRGRKDQTGEQGVSLMTMHGAKGLEFDTVFVIGGNEGVTPYRKAKLDEEIEEERRMFYVAMTRAKRKLVISYVKTKNGKELSPSRFVEELLLKEGESRH